MNSVKSGVCFDFTEFLFFEVFMTLYENERIDYVNDSLSLIQKPDGLTFGTDALLLAGFVTGKYNTAAEIGAGSGIISMLLLTREKISTATAIEVQTEYADLTRRNAELNGLSERLVTVEADIRNFAPDKEFELVFTNPPYMKSNSGKANMLSAKNIARHEIFGDISDFMREGARILKYGGTLVAVYRPDRLTDIVSAMRESSLEPKRMTLVYADTDSEPSIMLIEAKKGGKSGMLITSPLIIYEDKSHKKYSADMDYIMENGSFPSRFKR